MSKTFYWGIMGCGHIARKFAKDIAQIPNAKVYACASRSMERATIFAQKHEIEKAFDSYEQLAKCQELDAVYIATRHIQHHANTLLCLQNRMPVLCEKPLAMNSRQAREMVQAADDNNTYLMEALWTRFLPQTKKVLEFIDAGKIGTVQGIKADFGIKVKFDPNSRLLNKDLGGGSILDIGIYPIFLSLLILGKPEQIKAKGSIGITQVDQVADMLFTYANNKTAKLHSNLLKQTPTEAYIYGSKGLIHIHSRWHEPSSMSMYTHGGQVQRFDFKSETYGYIHEAEAVMQDLAQGKKQNEWIPHSFSLTLMEIIDEVRRQVGMIYPKFDS